MKNVLRAVHSYQESSIQSLMARNNAFDPTGNLNDLRIPAPTLSKAMRARAMVLLCPRGGLGNDSGPDSSADREQPPLVSQKNGILTLAVGESTTFSVCFFSRSRDW